MSEAESRGDSFDDPASRYDGRWVEALADIGRSGLVRTLVSMFALDAPVRVAQLSRAASVGDAVTVELIAHSLKSSAAQLGLTALAVRFERAERAGAAGDLVTATREVKAVSRELDSDIEWLRAATENILRA